MTHLSPGQFVDLAEGRSDAAAAAHSATCDACHAQVESLRTTLHSARADMELEPSPLFWGHLGARISLAVRRQRSQVASRRTWFWRLAPVAAASVLLAALTVGGRVGRVNPAGGVETPADVAPFVQAMTDSAVDDAAQEDPAWRLVSDLSAEMSADDAEAAESLAAPGGVDAALRQLTGEERRELARILREELATRLPTNSRGSGA